LEILNFVVPFRILNSFLEGSAESQERFENDGVKFFGEICENSVGRQMMLPFLEANFNKILEHSNGVRAIQTALWRATGYWNTRQQLQQVRIWNNLLYKLRLA